MFLKDTVIVIVMLRRYYFLDHWKNVKFCQITSLFLLQKSASHLFICIEVYLKLCLQFLELIERLESREALCEATRVNEFLNISEVQFNN